LNIVSWCSIKNT
jgi:hypothetical protein